MEPFAAGMAIGAALGAGAAWIAASRRTRRLGRFFSFAAHEINTPVTAINMTVLNLLGGVFGPLPAGQAPWIEMMREQINRLNGLVSELRDLIHLEFDKTLAMSIEEASAREVAETAAGSLRQGLAQAGIELVTDIPAELPALRADADRVARTLTSLLFHARKFRSSGPIRFSARSRGRFVEFAVAFEGPELSAAVAARSLEDPFFPAGQSQGRGMTATGMGLGTLRLVLREQGGDLAMSVSGRSHAITASIPSAQAAS